MEVPPQECVGIARARESSLSRTPPEVLARGMRRSAFGSPGRAEPILPRDGPIGDGGAPKIWGTRIDQPDDLNRLLAFLRDGHLARMNYLEQHDLLNLNNDGTYVGSSGFG
jgi:hypothetical protein